MKTDIRLGLVVAIAFFGLSGTTRADDDECTLRTLRGTYVFAASGHNIVGGAAQPKAIIEVLEFHGNGVLATTNGTLGVNGVTVHPRQALVIHAATKDPVAPGTQSGRGTNGDSQEIALRPHLGLDCDHEIHGAG